MRKFSLYGSLLMALLFSTFQIAAAQAPTMDDPMLKDGKIYVVVAVLVVILIGIILFLIGMERKLNKIEKRERPV